MSLSKERKLKKVHERAVMAFNQIESVMRDERDQCLEDRRFYSISGAQWEGQFGQQFENKPKLEVNKVHLSVMRIINEYRNNRITVDFISKEGEEYDSLASACDGLYRSDELDSCAEEAYDNAFEEAVAGGFGAWRLRAEYEDEEDDEDERQRIRIEPIYDADSSVFFDLNAKRQDKSDAKCCFVLTSMTPEAFEDEWNESPSSWDKTVYQGYFDWSTQDAVYVAEYYEVESVPDVVRIFKSLEGEETRYNKQDFEEDEELESFLLSTGNKEVRQKKVKRKKVHKYILSGGGVLEDCGYIAGSCIPVVPVYGKRWFIDNIERCMGHVRLSKDAQRLKNMQLSKLAEISALSPVRKPIMYAEQVEKYKHEWADDNIKNYPYLRIDPMFDANGSMITSGPAGYTEPPDIPQALAALLQLTDADMRELLGNQQEGEKMVSNISGEAIERIQNALDMQSYIYVSNMAKAIKRSGEIWLSMAKDILVEPGRKLKTVGSQGETSQVELLKPYIDEKTGEQKYENDFSEAKLDIYADVGPSSHSKREATVRNITQMMQMTTDQETMNVLTAMAMVNMEGEGLGDAREFFRNKLLRIGAAKPTKEEAERMQQEAANTPPDPNTQYLQAEAEKSLASAEESRADTANKIVEAEKTKAETAQIISEMSIDQREAAIKSAKEMQDMVQQ